MFRQVIAIISGVVVPWKLLRQDLHCGCIWIMIRPAWLVVGECSCSCKHNQCYSDFTVGILKVLLTTTTGCIDSLTYIIQLYAP
jgi:hypothetical protein